MEIRPDLSICLVAEAAAVDAAPCLQSLVACADPLALEVFVPATVTCGALQSWPHLHEVEAEGLSTSAFIDTVWRRARGRYLACWQSSVMAAPGCLAALVHFLDEHPDVAVVGPRFLDGQGAIQATAFQRRLPWDSVVPGWDGLSSMEVDWLSGEALVVNSLALTDIELPTNNPGVWERRLCGRVRKQGWHNFFVHGARAVSRARLGRPLSVWHELLDDLRRRLPAARS
ncbi:MAG: hypothetical protein C0613_10960 [Desulfobulbaceae bacterium]|nr:MAG: hypothetical protein C0613_10960 [Desulfobulbaceae bacterium]